jgi:ZIP family zinc transporter
VVQALSNRKSFQIANSSNFLSASLCLSAGVMVSSDDEIEIIRN